MHEELLIGLILVLGLGVSAQWLAWRFRFPSILLLLLFGFVAGPLVHLLDVDELLGELLFPIVSLSVAIILFEGGLTLRFKDLAEIGPVLNRLLTLGVVITLVLTALLANLLLGFDLVLSVLLGAILVVTGPTVVIPLLQQIRPSGRVRSILRWEGIVIDPIGAVLTVLIFEAIVVAPDEGVRLVFWGFGATVVIGLVLGYLAARALIELAGNHWIPDHLENPAVLLLVVGSFTISNLWQSESGLLTVTVMGIVLANQDLEVGRRFRLGGRHQISIEHIVEFKEILQVLLVSSLFILLSARLELADFSRLGISVILFILGLLFLVRPLAVWTCSLGSPLTWKERLFMAWMAPRGIVAAAVASIFGLQLIDGGYPGAELLSPVVFAVIIGTVVIYGLTAGPLARWLEISQANPQGVLIIGAHDWAREIGKSLQSAGIFVRLIDTNWSHVQQARMEGLPVYFGSVLSEKIFESLDMGNIGRVLALTSNDDVNSLACLKLSRFFGRANVYQLQPSHSENSRKQSVAKELRGRYLFDKAINYAAFDELFHHGGAVKTTKLTSEFTYDDFRSRHDEGRAYPLFTFDGQGRLGIIDGENSLATQGDLTLINLIATG